MMQLSYSKSPGELLRLTLDWTDDIGGATITSSLWRINTGQGEITLTSPALASPNTSVTVDGGTSLKQYEVLNKITLSTGEKLRIPVRIYMER